MSHQQVFDHLLVQQDFASSRHWKSPIWELLARRIMGNSYSEDARHSSSDPPVGYRVLSVDPNGPASKGRVVSLGPKLYPSDDAVEQARQQQVEREGQPALVSFFDFILSINGVRLVRASSRIILTWCQ